MPEMVKQGVFPYKQLSGNCHMRLLPLRLCPKNELQLCIFGPQNIRSAEQISSLKYFTTMSLVVIDTSLWIQVCSTMRYTGVYKDESW